MHPSKKNRQILLSISNESPSLLDPFIPLHYIFIGLKCSSLSRSDLQSKFTLQIERVKRKYAKVGGISHWAIKTAQNQIIM